VEEDWLQTIVNLPSVEFLDFVLEGRRLAAALRSQGAQLVIALTHMRMPNAIKYAACSLLLLLRLANGMNDWDGRLAQEAEIDLVLNGHDHFYEAHIPCLILAPPPPTPASSESSWIVSCASSGRTPDPSSGRNRDLGC